MKQEFSIWELYEWQVIPEFQDFVASPRTLFHIHFVHKNIYMEETYFYILIHDNNVHRDSKILLVTNQRFIHDLLVEYPRPFPTVSGLPS